MELERKAYTTLLEWKNRSNGNTALLIDGARRVGKSHLAREFGKKNYRSTIILDFSEEDEEILEAFKHDIGDLDYFFNKLSALKSTQLYPRESLIIFDEIQMFPLARQRIKKLVADGRYDYIETGSLISIRSNEEKILLPSEEEHLLLNPFDFEEFLWAMGDVTSVPFIRSSYDNLQAFGDAFHKKMMNRLREYMLIGGMPQVVSDYAEKHDMASADHLKRMILRLYRDDITRFAGNNKERVTAVFDKIPEQLSKKEKKYQLSSINKSARYRTYKDAFLWLDDGMIINRCLNATDPTAGLSLNMDSTTQKCYMADTGLLITHAFSDKNYIENELYKNIFSGKIGINEGMIVENLVAQMLRANGHRLFFYSRNRTINSEGESSGESIEIDFLIRIQSKICPIEVKSSSSVHHASLDKFVKKFGNKIGQPIILCTKDIMKKDGILYLPLYVALCL